MDRIAPSFGMDVIAQTGKGSYKPQNLEARASFAPAEFEALIERSKLIVSHAGIGTVLTAQRFQKPILLFPRRFDKGEHRNDHQVATVRHLQGRSGILIAMEESELVDRIAQGLAMTSVGTELSPTAKQLCQAIVGFIEQGRL
ncbi:glycosyltransferase [uncultured Erythrobacter sp.]|nr:glycosyltransferase [uncultured Erythrobacter sp.]